MKIIKYVMIFHLSQISHYICIFVCVYTKSNGQEVTQQLVTLVNQSVGEKGQCWYLE